MAHTNQQTIALVDCDAFFCNCERIFRPDLKNVPIGVLSNNDGCFVSRTKGLKALGVKMGQPYFKVRELCKKNNVAVFSSNFSLYINISERIMVTLSEFSPEIEVYSVDEAFLNLSGINTKGYQQYGLNIKNKIAKNIGVPVSVGIGPTKSIAKIATYVAKRNKHSKGVVDLNDLKLRKLVYDKVKIGEVWGFGQASTVKLNKLGIFTITDFLSFKNDKLLKKMFSKVGIQIRDELMGLSRFDIATMPVKKKEITCSRTFSKPVFSKQEMEQAVANYVSSACEKLRKQQSVCYLIDTYARTSPFKNVSQYYAFESADIIAGSADTRKIISYALSCLDKLYKAGYEYKKVGIKLSKLCDNDKVQLSLFENHDNQKSKQLMKCMDLINARDGFNTLRPAACGTHDNSWTMNRKYKSPRYVTGFSELCKVK